MFYLKLDFKLDNENNKQTTTIDFHKVFLK